jgi:hypothetical protein
MSHKNCPKRLKNRIFSLITFTFVLTFLFTFLLSDTTYAQTSDQISLQGKIVRNDTGYEGLNVVNGTPTCVASGADTCDFQVKYYSASTSGTLYLTETFSDVEIGDYDGVFNLKLGSGSATTTAECSDGTCNSIEEVFGEFKTIYLEIGFAPGGAGSFTETFTRTSLNASAFAMGAGSDSFSFYNTDDTGEGSLNAVAGAVYYNTTDDELKVYNGSSWVSLATGSSSLWTEQDVGADYSTYMSASGLGTFDDFTLDLDDDRLSIHTSQMEGGFSVYSSYDQTGGTWPLVSFKADHSNYAGTILELTQDGSGDILQGYSGSTLGFQVDNSGDMHLASNGIAYFEPFSSLPVGGDLSPNTGEGCLYSYGGSLYWDSDCSAGSPTALGGGTTLWTDDGTFTYLTSTSDDLVLGANTTTNAPFFFDVSEKRLGIGTGSPTAAIDIAGASSTISNTSGDITITPNEDLYIDGSVGIGTASPQNVLHVIGNIELGEGSTTRSLYAYNAARTYYGQLELYNLSTGDMTLNTTFDTGDIILSTGSGGSVIVKGQASHSANLTEWQNSSGTHLASIDPSGYAAFATSSANSSAILTLGANTTTVSQIRLTASADVDVSSPNSGDLWWNGNNLYFYNGTENVDLLSGGLGIYSEHGLVSDGSYLELVHSQNTHSVITNGWECVGGSNDEYCTGGYWKDVKDVDSTIKNSKTSEWEDDDTDRFCRTEVGTDNIGIEPTTALTTPEGYCYADTVYYTSSDTFSKGDYPWLKAIKVKTQAGGGGGTGSGTAGRTGGGGGGGEYAESFITDISSLSSSVSVTIGSGGNGGVGNSVGTDGGNSSFGSAVIAIGGKAAANGYQPGGHGGSGGTGDLLVGGGGGQGGQRNGDLWHSGGSGGDSHLGGGGKGGEYMSSGQNGSPGKEYGGGGGGASMVSGSKNGGDGADGIVIVELYADCADGVTIDTDNYDLDYYPYGTYHSKAIPTPNAQGYWDIRWDEELVTYGQVGVQTRSGSSTDPTDGTWEEWKPSTDTTNYLSLDNANTHTNWVGTNATVAEGDVTRDVKFYEDEDESTVGNITKLTSSTDGGYAEATISNTDISGYDYVTAWVRASVAGDTLRVGVGESGGGEQYENITIDTADTWQKIYWDISDITSTDIDAVTKLRFTNLTTDSNTIYIDNMRAESLCTDSEGCKINSSVDEYLQYRVILTTTNTTFFPQVESIQFSYSTGYSIEIYDEDTVRLYNNTGTSKYLKLDASTTAPETVSGQLDVIGDLNVTGVLELGTTGDMGTMKYDSTNDQLQFTNDGSNWISMGDYTKEITLSAEYPGAILAADGSDNTGSMTSDAEGTSSDSMNYYEWSSSETTLQDYDIRVRFTLPSDFVSWDTDAVIFNYATETTSSADNKADFYIYEESTATVDASFTDRVSSTAGVWGSATIPNTSLTDCDTAGETCVLILRSYSKNDNYTRIGDITLKYNREL